jgi:glycosyltransferase involved in cell wall biosynthesis
MPLLATVSDFTASVASRSARRVPAVTFGLLSTGPSIYPSSKSRLRRSSESTALVIIIGRLVPRKGQDRLIESLALLRDEYPRLHLAVIGDGRIAGRLERMAASHDVKERVMMTGALGTEELKVWLKAADIFACPCRTRWGGLEVEGFGIVFAEASLARLPVLAGRSGGAPESVKNGETGIIPTGDSSREVADALRRLLSKPRPGRPWEKEREFPLAPCTQVVGRPIERYSPGWWGPERREQGTGAGGAGGG